MARAIHMMVRVLDEERSVRFYRDVLGLEVADRFELESFVLLYLRNEESPFEVELVVNKGAVAAYDPGTGYGHVAFAVDDLEAERARLAELGHGPEPIRELALGGSQRARYFFVSDPDGYKIELLERGGRYR